MTRILLVEDDRDLAEGLCRVLEVEGFQVHWAADGEQGLALAQSESYDLLLLDVMIPGLDGFALLRRLRADGSGLPAIFLTAKGGESDVVRGLEDGADDYLTKPFSIRELLARLRAVLRRRQGSAGGSHLVGSMRVDLQRQELSGPGGNCRLSQYEAAILALLLGRATELVERQELLDRCWGDAAVAPRVVDFHITQLRRKLEQAGGHREPRHVITVYGRGYKLMP